jgi:hypothetical protein
MSSRNATGMQPTLMASAVGRAAVQVHSEKDVFDDPTQQFGALASLMSRRGIKIRPRPCP